MTSTRIWRGVRMRETRVGVDPDAPQRQEMLVQGGRREFWVWPHPRHVIWGATAAILLNLAARLREPSCCA